jgi:YidC/Oxa1 family membrane protein insertase
MNFLYTIIIFPIEQIIEFVYTIIYKLFEIPGLSIIGVSFAVTFLSLPLYVIAEKWQETERQTITKLKPKTDKIKQIFNGDERYMILSAYYRQNGYHPIYSLRNSLNILIQIPFFIAAYHFLSNFSELKGTSFWFLKELSKPDALFKIGNFSVNALPVLMTIINCFSGFIYTKKLELRDKLQVYALALVFLVLLYNSPSGLVLYWTTNNILSLIKNIFYKLKNPVKVLYIIICVFLVLFLFYLFFFSYKALDNRLILALFCFLILLIPIIIKLYIRLQNYFLTPLITDEKKRFLLFVLSAVVLTFITGLLIPSSVIASSPEEFSYIDAYQSPLSFVFITFYKSSGFFLFWPICIYFLFGKKTQSFLSLLFCTAAISSLFNTYVFQKNFSTISNTFTFPDTSNALDASKSQTFLAVFFVFAFIAVLLLLIKKNHLKIISTSFILLLFPLTVLSAYNIFTIQKSYIKFTALRKTKFSEIIDVQPIFHLSKDKPNLIIIMADKAIGGFVKPIFDEQPYLYNQFDGFTWYPNTLSFAMHTLMGVPPIWGGYEYTPKEMNNRNSVPLVEKYNESLLVIPRILSEKGYNVTVTDPHRVNFEQTRDTSIYEKIKNVQVFYTIGRYSDLWSSLNNFNAEALVSGDIIRNSLWFSFLKISPPFFRKIIYDNGKYWGKGETMDTIKDLINNYAVLDFLPTLTDYDSEVSSAILFSNEITHKYSFLQYPSYIPATEITDKGNGKFSFNRYYHVNSAFYKKTGEWLEELKKNHVYDNSRIIIVSDHGTDIDAMIADTELQMPNVRRESYNPVLLFKDFNSKGKLKTDMSFMTNADVPVLALDGIAETINPFTGKSLRENPKERELYITTNHIYDPHKHSKYAYNIKKDQWIIVKNNIYDPNNWEKVEE